MSEKEELKILRELLWKIGNASAGYKDDRIAQIVSEIRFGYCYGQSNSYEGQESREKEEFRIKSLERLKNI